MLESILKQLIGVARLGPAQRTSLQKALASRDRSLMLSAGQKVVDTLIQRGELVRVKLQGREHDGQRLYALRNHAQLLDLKGFVDRQREPAPATTPPQPAHDRTTTEPQRVSEISDGPGDALDYEDRDLLMKAMEQAQSLQAIMPGGQGTMACLDPILEMIKGYMPGLEIFAELHSKTHAPMDSRQLFVCEGQDRPFWSVNRVLGEAVWIPSLAELPRPLMAMIGSSDLVSNFVSGIAVPLYAAEAADFGDEAEPGAREIGLIYVLSSREYLRDELMKLAARLSRFVTHSWQQRLLMNQLVHTDRLTGLRNRGFFDSQFGLELERSRRQKSPLVLLLGDIDHFKDVNDTYGHPMGDLVLKTVARELLQGLRRIDVVCRVGGEEFALILPDTEMEAARDVVTRIQVRIANLRLTDAKHPEPLRVTISFGGVAFPEGGTEPAPLYALADKMLYLSKERGRNRCHFWRADDEPLLSLPQYKAD